MTTINLLSGDEVVFTATGPATLACEFVGMGNIQVRNAIAHRDEQIRVLRRELAEFRKRPGVRDRLLALVERLVT